LTEAAGGWLGARCATGGAALSPARVRVSVAGAGCGAGLGAGRGADLGARAGLDRSAELVTTATGIAGKNDRVPSSLAAEAARAGAAFTTGTER